MQPDIRSIPEPIAVSALSAATLIQCSKSFLDKLRLYRPEESPPFIRVGRRVLYPVAGLNEWLGHRTAQLTEARTTASMVVEKTPSRKAADFKRKTFERRGGQ